MQAHAGILGVTGTGPEAPVKAGVPVADLSAGLYATIGILLIETVLRSARANATISLT